MDTPTIRQGTFAAAGRCLAAGASARWKHWLRRFDVDTNIILAMGSYLYVYVCIIIYIYTYLYYNIYIYTYVGVISIGLYGFLCGGGGLCGKYFI